MIDAVLNLVHVFNCLFNSWKAGGDWRCERRLEESRTQRVAGERQASAQVERNESATAAAMAIMIFSAWLAITLFVIPVNFASVCTSVSWHLIGSWVEGSHCISSTVVGCVLAIVYLGGEGSRTEHFLDERLTFGGAIVSRLTAALAGATTITST